MTELRTPNEWASAHGVVVLDPDGWRRHAPLGPKDWEEPVTEREFLDRLAICTVRGKPTSSSTPEGG